MGKDKSERIVRQCLKGDRRAQRELYDTIGPALMGICRRYCPVKEDAEDVLTEAFVGIFTHLDTYNGHSMAELMAWCKAIAVYRSIDKWHADRAVKRRGVAVKPELADMWVSAPNMGSPDAERILAMMGSMPDKPRMVFNLHEVDGYGYSEMSEMLGMTVTALKVNYHRARKWLMERLKEDWSRGDTVH